MAQPDDSSHQLSGLVQDLADALAASGPTLALDLRGKQRWSKRLQGVAEAQRDELLAELIALAVALQRAHGAAAVVAVDQLSDLAAALLPADNVDGDTDSSDVDRAELDSAPAHAAVTGASSSKLPVGGGERPAGAVNPMALRLGGGAPKRKR